MIGQIIREVYGQNDQLVRDLVEIPVVAGCLFRSFDEFTQNLIFRMTTGGGSIERKELVGLMQKGPHAKDGKERFDASMANLEKLKIVSRSGFQNPQYTINPTFQAKLNDYIESPYRLVGKPMGTEQIDSQFFNLLRLLRENNPILRECRIGQLEGRLTKQNFDFIRLPLGYKISILVKGYLTYKKRAKKDRIIRDILCLSLAKPGRKIKMDQHQSEIIKELQMIRLVRIIGQGFFIVSQHLHNFAFEQKSREVRLLDCSMIVETNFKIYVQVPRGSKQNYQLLRDIMRLLVKVEHQEYNFEELIVGSITIEKMKDVFDCRINISEFLSFFRSYMFGDLSIEKDLGKWNKIHYLGLEGPAEEQMIPNNVKQELKLWQSMHKNKAYDNVMRLQFDEQNSQQYTP